MNPKNEKIKNKNYVLFLLCYDGENSIAMSIFIATVIASSTQVLLELSTKLY